MQEHATEVARGERFDFGANWTRFLRTVNDERVMHAEKSLCEMLAVRDLHGKRFLDAGSGSGLFSLAARRLGATVYSFDYDSKSVACTRALRDRFAPDDPDWKIDQGSVLDTDYLAALERSDVVYSWGVLHHTGAMWSALTNVVGLVAPRGLLFISIYNDQELKSRGWRTVKKLYCGSAVGRWLVLATFFPYFILRSLAGDIVKANNPLKRYTDYKKRSRAMSIVHDWVDWLGGYPFEVAKPEEVFDFCKQRGFVLERLKTCGGNLGCNEYVFRKCS